MWDYYQDDDCYCVKQTFKANNKVKNKKVKQNKTKYIIPILVLILFLTAIIVFPIFNYCCSLFLFMILLRIVVVGKNGLKKDINLISNVIGK